MGDPKINEAVLAFALIYGIPFSIATIIWAIKGNRDYKREQKRKSNTKNFG